MINKEKIELIIEFLKDNTCMIDGCMCEEERKTFKNGIVYELIKIINKKNKGE